MKSLQEGVIRNSIQSGIITPCTALGAGLQSTWAQGLGIWGIFSSGIFCQRQTYQNRSGTRWKRGGEDFRQSANEKKRNHKQVFSCCLIAKRIQGTELYASFVWEWDFIKGIITASSISPPKWNPNIAWMQQPKAAAITVLERLCNCNSVNHNLCFRNNTCSPDWLTLRGPTSRNSLQTLSASLGAHLKRSSTPASWKHIN